MFGEPTKARVERNPSLDPTSDGDWRQVIDMLQVDLEAIAKESQAIVRPRVIRSAGTLLRLILLFVLAGLSLRDTASWGARALGVLLTGEALGYRFKHAVSFVQQIVQKMLAARVRNQSTPGIVLRLIDASVLTLPGSTGTDWRVHVTYDPAAAMIVGVELTDGRGGEHVRRAAAEPGDLVIGDMGYGHASDMREAKARQVRALFRVHLQSIAIADLENKRMSPEQLLNAADKTGHLDRDVLLPEEGHETVGARLVVVPLPPEQAGRARQRLRKNNKGRMPNELTLRLAGYFCSITTLTKEQASAQALMAWYRVRWQVELLFKRCKSLMHLDAVTKAKPALVQLQIWARLLMAILVEKMASATRSAVDIDPAEPPVSLWRLDHVHWLDIVLVVYGGTSLAERLARAEETAARLRERPRRKRTWSEKLIKTISDSLNPDAILPAPG